MYFIARSLLKICVCVLQYGINYNNARRKFAEAAVNFVK